MNVVGFAEDRLARIEPLMQSEIMAGRLPGAVVLVVRDGQVVLHEAYGFRDLAARKPMRVDDIFRIASMTKPITVVAALMLAEEGRLIVAEAVAEYLPEFAEVKVGIEDAASGELTLVEPLQPMTIHDLMRHTSGLTYGFTGRSAIRTLYNEAGVLSLMNTNEQMVQKLARLPLAYHPGSTFDYGMSTDVLGRVVEVVSGQTLGAFLAERLFEPLGMHDTGFALPQAVDRTAEPHAEVASGIRVLMADPHVSTPWESGGGGLSSTAGDYLRFAQMLLNEGELDERRYLAPSTVALMASDHLPTGVGFDPSTLPVLGAGAPMPGMGTGFGLGVAVRTQAGRSPLAGSVGNFGWGGALGTYFWIDPKEKLIGIMMTQAPAERLRYRYLIQQMVYQGMVA